MNAKMLIIKKDYNRNENGTNLIDFKEVAEVIKQNLCNCPINKVLDAINIVAYQWNLKPYKHREFKIIKRIIVNSVLNN